VLAASRLAGLTARGGVPERERTRRGVVKRALEDVAAHLGNTPRVARSSYVDPRVIERFEEGHPVLPALGALGNGSGGPDLTDDATRAEVERAVVRLISG
jgi:DNA topoisomerase I